jgi:hypothetical protein
MLCDTRIAGPSSVQAGTGPGYHPAITFYDYRRIVLSLLGELGDGLFDRTGFYLKSGVALLNALMIDSSNSRGILQSCQTLRGC